MSTVHRYHPDWGDPEDAVLWDGCERCEEHANLLVDLDDSKLRTLWNRLAAVEGHRDVYRTRTEALAGSHLWRLALVYERLTGQSWRELRRVQV